MAPGRTEVSGRGTDADVIRNVTINPAALDEVGKTADVLTISLREDDVRYRINGALSLADNAALDLVGNLLEVDESAFAQLIQNAGDTGPVSIAINDQLLLEDVEYRNSSGYFPIPVGSPTVEVFSSDGTLLFSDSWTTENGRSYVGLFEGLLGSATQPLNLQQLDSRQVAGNPARVEFIISNGSPDSGPIDVRTLDPNNSNLPIDVLADNLAFGETTGFLALEADVHTIDVSSSSDGSVFDAYQFDFSGLEGKTLTLVASGSPFVDDPGDLIGYTLLAVDATGATIAPKIVTSASGDVELPAELVLHGNYPNPFAKTTTVLFDLPRPAEVELELVDVLGRIVRRFSVGPIGAGFGQSVTIDATDLGPATYFYRLRAHDDVGTLVEQGQFVVVK